MAQPEEARDPSMEEILASIRRIIAEDGDDPNTQPHLSVVSDPDDATIEDTVEMAADTVSDGLGGLKTDEATGSEDANTNHPFEVVSEDAAIDASPAVSTRDSAPPSVDDADQSDEPDSGNPEPEPTATAFETIESEGADRLLSPQADHAVHGAFDQLASTILNDQARTLEDLVRDMMRPMLQHWLDDNLPVLVERLVREEIERVSRGRR